jgi:hypothetical protein
VIFKIPVARVKFKLNEFIFFEFDNKNELQMEEV